MIALLPPAGPLAFRVAALGVALGWLPGTLIASRVWPTATPGMQALAALALSPFLIAGPAAALMALGASSLGAARALLGGWIALALVILWRARREPAFPRPRGEAGVMWFAAALWTAAMAALLIGNPHLPPRSDGWFHQAVVRQIVHSGIPPEDPYFAGLRLLYFWGYHVWGSLWLALEPRTDPAVPLVALNLAGAFAVVLGVCMLAQRLGASRRGIALSATVATLGYAPFAWVWFLVRAMSGEVRGLEELERSLMRGVDPILFALGTGTLHSSLAFFGDKFLVLTPFSLGLGLLVLFGIALLDLSALPSWRNAVALGLVLAAALFTHTVVGFTCLGLAGAWWIGSTWRAAAQGEARSRRLIWPLALACAAAAVVTAPYLAAIVLGKRAEVRFQPSMEAMLSWLFVGAVLVPAGMLWLFRYRREKAAARDLLGLVIPLTVVALVVKMPDQNQSKYFNMLFLLLAAPAALQWLSIWRGLGSGARKLLAAGAALALAPGAALCVWGFATERNRDPVVYHAPSAPEREAFAWIRQNLGPKTVFVDLTGPSDLLALTGRSVIWGGPSGERDWGYPEHEIEARRRAAREIFAGGRLSADSQRLVERLGRDVVVVVRRDAPGQARVGLEASKHPLLFANQDVRLYRWVGP